MRLWTVERGFESSLPSQLAALRLFGSSALHLRQIIKDYLNHFKYKSGPLIRGSQGNRLCKQSLMNSFNKIKERAGLPKEFKIHSFRRFFINELRKNHVDIATIQKLAGHRDIRTTEIYCNVSEEEKVKAIESIKV